MAARTPFAASRPSRPAPAKRRVIPAPGPAPARRGTVPAPRVSGQAAAAPPAAPAAGRRLAAFLADCGVASRRKAEELVRAGKVTVNGRRVTDPAFKVTSPGDRVEAAGAPVRPPTARSYILLHKPRGVVSAASSPEGKPTVVGLLPHGHRRLYPVGRLDVNAEGLILLTDDGEAANRMTHPRYQVPRTYLVKVKGQPVPGDLGKLVRGVRDAGELLRAREAAPHRSTGSNAWFRVVMTEGKNREIRRLFEAIGHFVVRIVRVSYGPLELGDLPQRSFRTLSRDEVRALRAYLKLDAP